MRIKLLLKVLLLMGSITISAQDKPTTPTTTIEETEETEETTNILNESETTLEQYSKLKKKVDELKVKMESNDKEIIGVLNAFFDNAILYKKIDKKDQRMKDKKEKKYIEEVKKKQIEKKVIHNKDVKEKEEKDERKEIEKETIKKEIKEFEKKFKPRVVQITKITGTIKEGYINDVTFYVGNKKYTNKNAPISLTHKRFSSKEDKIELIGGTDYFILQEIIHLDSLKQYVPEDVSFTLDGKKPFELKRGVGINNIFDIRLYSDALALFGDQENGLVQTDLRYKNILHRKNFPNTGFTSLQYLKVNVSASKFDSKDKYIITSDFKNSDLLQKSYFNAEAALNLLNGWIEFKSMSKFYIDAGAGIASSRINTATDSINVTNTNFFIEGGLNLKSSSNIGLDMNARMIRFFSPSTQIYTEYLNKQYFNFLEFGVDFYWHPLDDESNRLFARVNYFTPTNSIEKKNDFFQFQIGYSIMLSDLIK